jgi:hypothetical protein
LLSILQGTALPLGGGKVGGFKVCDKFPQGVFALQPFSGIGVEDIKLFLSNRPFTGGVLPRNSARSFFRPTL